METTLTILGAIIIAILIIIVPLLFRKDTEKKDNDKSCEIESGMCSGNCKSCIFMKKIDEIRKTKNLEKIPSALKHSKDIVKRTKK